MEANAQQRAKWVERWKDSGLTAKEFAAEADLKASALYNWGAQLASATRKRSVVGDDAAPRALRSAAPLPRVVELPVAALTSAPLMIELLLGDVRVRVPSGVDEVTLTRVVRVLAGLAMIPMNVRIFVCTEPVDMRSAVRGEIERPRWAVEGSIRNGSSRDGAFCKLDHVLGS